MPINEPKPQPTFNPLMAQIFTKMASDRDWTENQLEKIQQDEIRSWKSKFLMLFEAVENANEHVDSVRIERLLSVYSWDADRAAQELDDK